MGLTHARPNKHIDNFLFSPQVWGSLRLTPIINPPIDPIDLTPNLFSNSNIHSTVNAHSNSCTNQKAGLLTKQNLGGSGLALSEVGHGSGVQRDQNLVGCNPAFAKNRRSGASPIPGFVLNCYVIVMNTGICYVIVMIVM